MLTCDLTVYDLRNTSAIVIGASAGGLHALDALLPAFPANTKLPVIIVLHIPASKPSLLVEIFTPKCNLKVREPDDKQEIGPGIWFAPPGYHLLVERDKTFALSVDDPVNYSRPSIDVLFQSASDVFGNELLGIVLSGANSDGAAGSRIVRENGGILMVQDPNEAEAEAMPRAAIEATNVQCVAPLSRIADLLRDLTVSSQ
ncbi:MAG: chemotaxis protein CheB [Polyangiaceae bacterium]